jgi:hypothetical protein
VADLLATDAELLNEAPPDLEARLEAEAAADERLLEAEEAAATAAAETLEAEA